MLLILLACHPAANTNTDDTDTTATGANGMIQVEAVEVTLALGVDIEGGSNQESGSYATKATFYASTSSSAALAWAPVNPWDTSVEKTRWADPELHPEAPRGPVAFSNGDPGYIVGDHTALSEVRIYTSFIPGDAPKRGTYQLTAPFGWGICEEDASDVATYGTCTPPLELEPFDVPVVVTIQ